MKVVLDSNVWLSAIFWEGEASKIIELADENRIEIIVSRNILDEIALVLNRESKFQKFLTNRNQNIVDILKTILVISKISDIKSRVHVIKKHPQDNMILEVAIDGKVDFIISYNKHVLDIRKFRGIKIISPSDFLRFIN